MRGIVIHPDSTVEDVIVDGSLESIKAIVGGWIEYVGYSDFAHGYIDEDGKTRPEGPRPANALASALFAHVLKPGDYIAGSLIMLGEGDDPPGSEGDIPQVVATMVHEISRDVLAVTRREVAP